MAIDVKKKSRSALPGAGKDSNGVPVQGKTRVVGEIAVTSYSHNGENLTPADLGLDTIDYLDLVVKNAVTGTSPSQGIRKAYYADDSAQFYCTKSRIAGGESELVTGSTLVLKFVAEGDASDAPQLR